MTSLAGSDAGVLTGYTVGFAVLNEPDVHLRRYDDDLHEYDWSR